LYLQSGANVKDVVSKTKMHPRKRLAAIYDLCKGKKLCEGGDEFDKENGGLEEEGKKKVSHFSKSHISVLNNKREWR